VTWMTGGYSQARARLESFIEDGRLERFHEERNDPARDGLSHLSPYLHYGQISALEIALEASRHPGPGTESFLEELIVRRELAFNFVAFNADYDRFECLPNWAREDLEIHAADRRPYLYSPGDLEKAQTHDPYWNAAQKELVYRGKIHGYMRMYWGKKILEWSDTPRNAYTTAVYLNDRYSLDGRDPNGYAGVAWCFGKHDRPWAPRPVFGKVRYMNDRGLERKFDIRAYVERVNSLVAGALESQ
jgi:deoxyribodipyrimidine photo-lyase